MDVQLIKQLIKLDAVVRPFRCEFESWSWKIYINIVMLFIFLTFLYYYYYE